ncbi:MAG: hypothetical protein OXH96_09420 [Spirochaetaceae bacterium]|nr:hypothetical protein [Spirochaetaceae bacterium]
MLLSSFTAVQYKGIGGVSLPRLSRANLITGVNGVGKTALIELVATTHSAECIKAATKAFADAPDELSVHRLFTDRETGKVRAATFTGETLEGARDLNLEIR